MTQEEKQIAIAKHLGWRFWPVEDELERSVFGNYVAIAPNETFNSVLPDYFNDLNAMHEAEKTLWSRNDWSACRYQETLQSRVMATESWTWHATAMQRSEAFGLTLGLWKEGE